MIRDDLFILRFNEKSPFQLNSLFHDPRLKG